MKNNLNLNKKSFFYVILLVASTVLYFVKNKEDRNKYVNTIKKYSLILLPIYAIKKIFDLNFIPEESNKNIETIDEYIDDEIDFDSSDLELDDLE